MTVKLIILKSGEKIISDIKELYSNDNPDLMMSYLLENPCYIKINGKYRITTDEGESKDKMAISLHSWPDFSADTQVVIPPDWLVSAVTPIPSIEKMYVERNKTETNQVTFTHESTDSDFTD